MTKRDVLTQILRMRKYSKYVQKEDRKMLTGEIDLIILCDLRLAGNICRSKWMFIPQHEFSMINNSVDMLYICMYHA